MPLSAALTVCGLLIAAACAMALESLALGADGSFQLVRVLATDDVWGLDTRILAAWAHQAAVVIALRAGVTDTHVLSILLGVGHFLVPAIAWSLAILLTQTDRLVCAAVTMVAGLAAGATSFISVSETVVAGPLTVLAAVLLWQLRVWGWLDVLLAAVVFSVLVATYETALVTGSVLAVWAAWRATRSPIRLERYACALASALSVASVVVALAGTQSGENPTHSRDFVYYVVSLDPWPFYLALAGIVVVVAALGQWLDGPPRLVVLTLGVLALVVALVGLEPNTFTAFRARGGGMVAAFVVQTFLFWRWIRSRDDMKQELETEPDHDPRVARALVVVPLVFVTAMLAANVRPLGDWSRSLDAFRTASTRHMVSRRRSR